MKYSRVSYGNNPPLASNWLTRNRLRGLAAGLIVRILVRMPAQVAAGSIVGGLAPLLMHGTRVPPSAASPAMIGCWAPVGRNTLVLVNSGTAFWAFEIRPSKAANTKVLFLEMGKPTDPPN